MPGSTAAIVGFEARHGVETTRLGPQAIRQHDGRRTAVDAGRVTGRDRSIFAKCRLQRGERLKRGLGPVMLVRIEDGRALAAGHLDRHDLAFELSGGLSGREALLRSERPLVPQKSLGGEGYARL
jgi:hypothetical protein